MKKIKYPNGTKLTNWYLAHQPSGNPRIRREAKLPDGTWKVETHPLASFKHLVGNDAGLNDYVIRLNGKDPRIERIKDRLSFEHAFIGPTFLDEYQEIYLRNSIPSQQYARELVYYVKEYALNYFIGRLGLANPIEWKQNESRWGLALVGKQSPKEPKVFDDDVVRSAKVLRMIVYELNRFMRFLHTKHPDIPAITFEPLSRAVLKEHEARRKMRGEVKESRYIPEDHWKKIKKALPDGWGDVIKLCYSHGLRRKEAYGLQPQDLKKGYLSIDRQLDRLDGGVKTFKPLKGREVRKTPHWFAKPSETYELIRRIQETTTHPDTITQKFPAFCKQLGLPEYNIHDLRRTFITNCVQAGKTPEDTRLAVGHVDGTTTYKYYVMDARKMDEEVWTPDDKAS